MREILFRGKRLDNGEWVEGYLWCDETYEDCTACFICGLKYHLEDYGWGTDPYEYGIDPKTVGQYVGVEDSNGKMVFDGDVIKFSYFKDKYIGKAVFNEATNGFELWYNSTVGAYGELATHKIHFSNANDLEVIGNIYDNPELLKEGVKDELFSRERERRLYQQKRAFKAIGGLFRKR